MEIVVDEEAFAEVRYVSYRGLSRVPTRTGGSGRRGERNGGERDQLDLRASLRTMSLT